MYLNDKFQILLDNYYKKSQVLAPGESSLSFDEIKSQALFYKTKLQNAEKHPWPGWKEPGKTALQVLDIILSGGNLDSGLAVRARQDVFTNFKNTFTEAELQQFAKILDNYANLKHASSKNNIIKNATAADSFKQLILNEETIAQVLEEFKLGLDLYMTKLHLDDTDPVILSMCQSQANLIKSALNEVIPDIKELDRAIIGDGYDDVYKD